MNYTDYNAGMDIPDDRDILINELGMASDIKIPDVVELDYTPILNQGNIGSCTVFGSLTGLAETSASDLRSNGINEYKKHLFDPWKVWDKAKKRGASDIKGWSLQAALQLLKDTKLVIGYARVSMPGKADVDTLCRHIASGRAIVTGSAKGDWGKISTAPFIYKEKSTNSGHIYSIIGYDRTKKLFKVKNTWDRIWGDNGCFYISFDDIHKLYSCYILLDSSDVGRLNDYTNMLAEEYATLAKKIGIWNGEHQDWKATDEEIKLMINRALNVMGIQSRRFYGEKFNNDIIRGKDLMTVWNGKDEDKRPTERELASMFTRAAVRDSNTDERTLTRKQVAIICLRDLYGKDNV